VVDAAIWKAAQGILLRSETAHRPDALRMPELADGHRDKLVASYDHIERDPSLEEPLHIGHIALATALSWIVFRELPGFRDGRPRLAQWYERFSRRPSMLATRCRARPTTAEPTYGGVADTTDLGRSRVADARDSCARS
jgi:glutathione S-transferase